MAEEIKFDYKFVSLQIDMIMPELRTGIGNMLEGYLEHGCIYSEELLPQIEDLFEAIERTEKEYPVKILEVRDATETDNARCLGIDVYGKNLPGNDSPPREIESKKPTVICLCGSTKFYKEFQQANREQTLLGKIVLSVGSFTHSSEQAHGERIEITEEQKEKLDTLHLQKIDMADEVLILNKNGYVGESTARELHHAMKTGKRILYLEQPPSLRDVQMQGFGGGL